MSHRESFDEDYQFEVEKTKEGGYSVTMPHQCGSWEILGAEVWSSWDTKPKPENATSDYPNLPKDKNLAITQMELFVKRAEEALNKLKELK